jgi:signal transduction histidine kinase
MPNDARRILVKVRRSARPGRRLRAISPRAARLTANALCAVAGLLVIASIALVYGRDFTGQDSADWFYLGVSAAGAAVYLVIGRAIVTRQPGNTIGWLLLAIPMLALFTMTNGSYATRALVFDPGSLPFGRASAWLDRWLLVPTLSLFIPLFLLYPDGTLPSRRWRPVALLTFAAPVLASVAFAVTPGRLTGAMSDLTAAHVTNPLGIDAAAGAIDVLTQVGGFLILVSAIAAVVAMVARYRRANGEVRQQIRWLAFVGVAFLAELGLATFGEVLIGESNVWGNVVFTLMFLTLVLGIPAACGVAILKYHLYDLNLVIRKTVVYAALAGFVTVVYAAVVAGLSQLVGGNSLLLSIVATAIVAALFQPVRRWATRLANRLVFGKRAEPYDVLARFSDRVGETYAAEDVLPRMARVIAEGTGAESVEISLRFEDEMRPAASWPPQAEPLERSDRSVDVIHQGEVLGDIRVRTSSGEPLTGAEEKLLVDLSSQAGVVLRNVGLAAELQRRVDELSTRAGELHTSRIRIVAAHDAERRRLERNIHDGAQQHLVALAVKLRLARALAGKDPAKAGDMLRELSEQTERARTTLLDLASGIYPATLEERGIVAALEEQTRAAGAPVAIEADGEERLPIETEAAVYFVCLEAIQNAEKYARASRVRVRLERDDGVFAFEVSDDGAGFDPAAAKGGSGLQNMRDRLSVLGGDVEISSTPGAGTVVRGRVPFPEGAAA